MIFLILLSLTVLLLFPIGIKLNYTGDFNCVITYLFFKFNLPNTKENKTIKKQNKPNLKEEGKKQKPKKHKRKLSCYIDEYKTPILNILKSLKKLLRKIVVKEFLVNIVVGDEDASTTAVEYGALCASVYPLLSAFESFFEVKNKSYNIKADFEEKSTSAVAVLNIRFRALYALATLTAVIYTFIKLKLKK